MDNLGYDITLTICGCIPPLEITHPNIRVIPFLNKNIKKEYHDYLKIMHQTHLLFLPTRADCTPIVFCEANAFGIPVVTADTGGVTSIIKDGENGIVLPFESTPNDYAKKIQSLLDCTNEIKEMSLKSRIRYNKELNWGVWSKKMRELLLLTSHNLNNDLVRRV